MDCPHCSRSNDQHALICTYCGGLIVNLNAAPATRSLGDTDFEESESKWGTARFNARMNLVLRVHDQPGRFAFDAERSADLLVGRFDPIAQFSPDVDLAAFGAADKGVSRRHAAIVRRDGALHLVDLESPNGTYLNGQKLIPNQARVLRDGDDIRLGHLVLRVTFEQETDGA